MPTFWVLPANMVGMEMSAKEPGKQGAFLRKHDYQCKDESIGVGRRLVDTGHRHAGGTAGDPLDVARAEEPPMRTGCEGLRLRVFIHEELRYDHKPLYAHIVEMAHREGLAGAVVFRGIEGYGLHRHLHTTRLLDVSDDLPMIVELVDKVEAIRRFLLLLDPIVPHGMATLSPVRIVTYRKGVTP